MGEMVDIVVEYCNMYNVIGYIFCYYVMQMYSNKEIKLLVINDVVLMVENICNGSYLYMVDVYMVICEYFIVEI